jgi:hypothetical protein
MVLVIPLKCSLKYAIFNSYSVPNVAAIFVVQSTMYSVRAYYHPLYPYLCDLPDSADLLTLCFPLSFALSNTSLWKLMFSMHKVTSAPHWSVVCSTLNSIHM